MSDKDFRKPYTNYSNYNSAPRKQFNQPIKEDKVAEEVVVEEVSDNKVEEPSQIERVDNIAEVVIAKRKVVPANLNVRVAPNAQAAIVRIVSSGTELNVLEYVDNFARIGDNEYVNIDYLD